MFEVDGKILIFLLLQLIVLLKLSVGIDESADFHLSVLTHPLESGVFPEGVLNLDVDLMDLYLQVVDFGSEVIDGLLVDIDFDSK